MTSQFNKKSKFYYGHLLGLLIILVFSLFFTPSHALVPGSNVPKEWNYSNWSECINGQQTRQAMCEGVDFIGHSICNSEPILSRPCQIDVCTDWDYSDWGKCIDNQRIRTILNSRPAGCMGGSPTSTQPCQTCLTFYYSAWSDCIDGRQSRVVVGSLPERCLDGNPVTSRLCEQEDNQGINSTPQQVEVDNNSQEKSVMPLISPKEENKEIREDIENKKIEDRIMDIPGGEMNLENEEKIPINDELIESPGGNEDKEILNFIKSFFLTLLKKIFNLFSR